MKKVTYVCDVCGEESPAPMAPLHLRLEHGGSAVLDLRTNESHKPAREHVCNTCAEVISYKIKSMLRAAVTVKKLGGDGEIEICRLR